MLEILPQVLLNVLGRQSAGIWTPCPGEGLQDSGACGSAEDRGAWVDGWAETGLDVFSVIIPGLAGASSRLPTFLVYREYLKSALSPRRRPPVLGTRSSCFVSFCSYKPQFLGFPPL